MPAGTVRPRASRAPRLGAGAVAEYRAAGWSITVHGRVSDGRHVGPCVACRAACVRYGPGGRPCCDECEGREAT